MYRYVAFFVLWFSALAGLSAGSNEPAELELYRKLVHDLAAESMEGRGPGTLGLERARDYLAEFFSGIGLEAGFSGSYYQELEIKPGGKHTTVLLKMGGRFARRNEDFAPHLFSGDGVFAGPIVMLEESSFQDEAALRQYDLDNKTVVLRAGGSVNGEIADPSRVKALAHMAAAHGALALLLAGPLPVYSTRDLKRIKNKNRVSIPVLIISQDYLRRLERFAGELAQDDKGDNEDQRLEGKVVMLGRAVTVHNVAAILPGAGSLAAEYVIVGGHYDHLGFGGWRTGTQQALQGIHHGADDNASGTAGVLLLAARFARRQQQSPPLNRRTLVFVGFTAEETGLEGSAYMANHFDEMGIEATNVASMINFDMIGRMSGNTFFVYGWRTGHGWWQMTKAAAAHYGLNAVRGNDYFQRSDQYSFYLKQIPCLFFFAGNHRDYHTITDTAEKINYPGAVRLLQAAEAVLYDQWTHPERLQFRRVPRKLRNLR